MQSLAALSAVAEETGAQSGPPSVEPAKSDSTRIDESVAVSPETSHAAVVDAVAHRRVPRHLLRSLARAFACWCVLQAGVVENRTIARCHLQGCQWASL